MSWLLKKLAGWGLGVSGLGSPVFLLIVAVGLGMAAAAAWMRDEAVEKCNASWQLEIAAKNNELLSVVRQREAQIANLDRELARRVEAEESKIKEDELLMKGQADDFPLSADCAKCRVPNERIWVRRASSPASTPVNRGKGPPGS